MTRNVYLVSLRDGSADRGNRLFMIGANNFQHAHSLLMQFLGEPRDEPLAHLIPMAQRLPTFKFKNMDVDAPFLRSQAPGVVLLG